MSKLEPEIVSFVVSLIQLKLNLEKLLVGLKIFADIQNDKKIAARVANVTEVFKKNSYFVLDQQSLYHSVFIVTQTT